MGRATSIERWRAACALVLAAAVAACAPVAAPTSTTDPASAASYAPIDPARMTEITRTLASDE